MPTLATFFHRTRDGNYGVKVRFSRVTVRRTSFRGVHEAREADALHYEGRSGGGTEINRDFAIVTDSRTSGLFRVFSSVSLPTIIGNLTI